jgi:hypothetical protein
LKAGKVDFGDDNLVTIGSDCRLHNRRWADESWTTAAGITSGAVFRPVTKGQDVQTSRLTDRGLVKIIKRHATRVGLDPREFSGACVLAF